MVGLERVAALEAERARDLGADHGLAQGLVEGLAVADEVEAAALDVLEVGEDLRRRADDAEALVVVPDRVRDRELHAAILLERRVHRPGDVPGGRLQVEDRVQDELGLAPARAEDGVEADGAASEGRAGLGGHREHSQPARQRRRQDGDRGREGVLPQGDAR